MRPLQETSLKRPTMCLRDPITTYKCFESISTPSPITPLDGNSSTQNDNRSSNLHRAASLDSLANSTDQESSTDDPDDFDKLSDVDSLGNFGCIKRTTCAQIHRKTDINDNITVQTIPKEPIIKAYLEKASIKNDYKTYVYKKIPSAVKDKPEEDIKIVSSQPITTNGNASSSTSPTSTCTASGTKTRKNSITSSESVGRMETILEEPTEPKVSVKEILARFETMNSLEVWINHTFFLVHFFITNIYDPCFL